MNEEQEKKIVRAYKKLGSMVAVHLLLSISMAKVRVILKKHSLIPTREELTKKHRLK
jgi:hypothetical protein